MARKVIEPLVQTSVRLYQSDFDAVQQLAAEDDRDPASMIRKIVRDYIKENCAA